MKSNRREFLTTTGKGLLLIGAIPLLNACSSLIRDDLIGSSESSKSFVNVNEDYIDILYYASLAPSSHNTQPWGVKIIDKSQFILCIDKQRLLPNVDPDMRETILSLGTFIENFKLAALHYGYKTEIKILPGYLSTYEIVELNLIKTAPVKIDLRTISERRTVRSNFSDKQISRKDFEFICENDENFTFFPNSSAQGKYLINGTIEANKTQTYRNGTMEELSEWIRWSNSEAEKHRDGLTPASMGITGFGGWFVRNFYDKDSVTSESFKSTGIEKAEEQARQSGGWIALSSSDSSVENLIDTGRKLQRMLLKIRAKNIAVHPMSQMLEEEPFKNEIENMIGINNKIQFILRVGYINSYPKPVSLRRPVEWFTSKI